MLSRRTGHVPTPVETEHERTLEERAKNVELREEITRLKGEILLLKSDLHDRDMTILELKARLYDLMTIA